MVQTLDSGQRVARKEYRCGLCLAIIHPGDHHAFQNNIYDGRVYTWRDCLACDRDGVCNYVHDWSGGYHDEGVGAEEAVEWAREAALWPTYWIAHRPIATDERLAARNFLARITGEE